MPNVKTFIGTAFLKKQSVIGKFLKPYFKGFYLMAHYLSRKVVRATFFLLVNITVIAVGNILNMGIESHKRLSYFARIEKNVSISFTFSSIA